MLPTRSFIVHFTVRSISFHSIIESFIYSFFPIFLKKLFIYFEREGQKEREHTQVGEEQRQRIPSSLHATNTKLNAISQTHEIMT